MNPSATVWEGQRSSQITSQKSYLGNLLSVISFKKNLLSVIRRVWPSNEIVPKHIFHFSFHISPVIVFITKQHVDFFTRLSVFDWTTCPP